MVPVRPLSTTAATMARARTLRNRACRTLHLRHESLSISCCRWSTHPDFFQGPSAPARRANRTIRVGLAYYARHEPATSSTTLESTRWAEALDLPQPQPGRDR